MIQPGSPAPNAMAQAPAQVPDPASQHPQGARVPTGLPYGQAQLLSQAQHQMPVAGPTGSGPAPAAPSSPPTPGNALPPDHPQVLNAAQNWSPPIQPLHRPTDRPLEPIQSGIKTGPGPGPEAVNLPQTNPATGSLTNLLANLAQRTGSASIASLAQRAQAMGA